MALPRLNDNPQYELTIPSSGEKINYRPFLVREQKILLMAAEAEDTKQVITSILNCIEGCAAGINVKKLSTFDVDYIFTQIRSKSVGETSTILANCTKCEHKTEIKIKLDDIKVDTSQVPNNILKLNDEISVKMKYPSYIDMMENNVIMNEKATTAETLFAAITSCLESVMTEDENIQLKDESQEEVEAFVNSLSSNQFDMISGFMNSIPRIKYEQVFNCESCNEENKLELQGIQDFFS